jgi:hypothetical protein
MEIGAQLKRQRIKHIVSSYQLDGDETEAFDRALERLLNHYPLPLIELALVETLVDRWLHVPLLRGCKFLDKAHEQLQAWENQILQSDSVAPPCTSTISPEQFHQITGLDPAPIYGASQPVSPPPIHS